MKISVLMSVYDKEKTEYLKESIESIVNQTIKPNQIVIIKDGPVRLELNSVLNEYKNKYYNLFDIYQLDKNVGLGQALNYGVHKCKCEYIARMDTDDIAPLNRFEEQIKVLEEYPNLDLLGGYIEEYDCNMKKRLRVRKVPLEMEQIKKKIKYMCPFNHGTLIIKKWEITVQM